MSDKKLLLRKFFEYTFTKHKARVSITKYLRRRVLTRSVWKIFKNREIIRNHREVGRNEPKWGDLLVGWRETAGLENSSMGWFQPQLRIIYCYKKVCVIFFFFFFFLHTETKRRTWILLTFHISLRSKKLFTLLFCSHENLLKARVFWNNAIPLGIHLCESK